MPFGFGAHPYFHAPLSSSGSREALSLQLDAVGRWPLDARLIPSGPPVALDGKYDLRIARPLGAETYDDAFRMRPATEASAPRARMADPSLKVAVEVCADPAFGDFVLFAPAGNPVVAIEPYTCAPDAFNLSARGIDSGARELAPGETFEVGFEIRLSAP